MQQGIGQCVDQYAICVYMLLFFFSIICTQLGEKDFVAFVGGPNCAHTLLVSSLAVELHTLWCLQSMYLKNTTYVKR